VSQENIRIVQGAFAAYFRGDEQGLRAIVDPEVTVTTRPDQPDVSDHHGVDGLIAFLGEWAEAWDEYTFEVQRVREVGDLVIASTRQRGQGKRSGVPIDDEVTFVFSVRNGRIVRLQMFGVEQQALEALADLDLAE
jgi:ketosteroid isomerase-like protein